MPDTTYGVVIRHAVIERFSQIVNEDLHGYVKISDSLIRDIGWRSVQLRYPTQDSFIERNTFVRAAGVFIQEAKIPDGARLYVRWNRFVDFWAESLPEPGWVNTYGGEGEPTIVSGNTFQTVGHVAVDLVAADPSAGWIPGLDATGNDWGTTDTNVIESMIRDVNDDPNLVSSIPDMPYLDAADPLTPPPYQEAHARSVSIRLRVATRQAAGDVRVGDTFSSSVTNVAVKVQRKVDGAWRGVASGVTDVAGTYLLAIPRLRSGKYRTMAPPLSIAPYHRCAKAVSTIAIR